MKTGGEWEGLKYERLKTDIRYQIEVWSRILFLRLLLLSIENF